jgi:hypothetical protein
MNINIFNKILNLANKNKVDILDDFSPADYGQYDDCFYGGVDLGEISLAREILQDLLYYEKNESIGNIVHVFSENKTGGEYLGISSISYYCNISVDSDINEIIESISKSNLKPITLLQITCLSEIEPYYVLLIE